MFKNKEIIDTLKLLSDKIDKTNLLLKKILLKGGK